MNRLALCLLFSVTTLVASSQKVYFVYIQTETDQPFFIKMNEKISSSTGSGYLILSKLRDSSYNFTVGFPQNKWPEQSFSVTVGQKDHGYLLKNFGEKGWGLFDLQTLAVQMSSSKNISNNAGVKTDDKDVSAFTNILSQAADDPSLKDKPVPKIEEKKADVAAVEVVKKDVPVAEQSKTVAAPVVKTPDAKIAVAEPVVTKPADTISQPVVKKEEPKTETKNVVSEPVTTKPVETVAVPVVKNDEPKETITIKPLDKVETAEVKQVEPKVELKESAVTRPIDTVSQPIVKEEAKVVVNDEYKQSVVTKKSESSTTEGFGLVFLDDYQNGIKDTIRLIIPNPKPSVVALKEEPKEEVKEEKKFLDIVSDPTKKAIVKNSCKAIADGSDFQKLRKNMAAKSSDDEMVNEAAKYFKTKCFTVHQLENLQTLFLNDAGKYKFFDAAYNFASDIENFSSLQSQLKDEYYINRFKAMLRN